MESWIIRTKNLKKYYQLGEHTVKALDGMDFLVREREFVAVIGDCAIIGLNRKNLTKSGFLRHSPISLTRKRKTQSLPD